MLIFRVAIYAAGDMQPTRLPNNRHNDAQLVAEEFRRRHGAQGRVFAAPGRVNLIGEHTDYNDGFVMPAAIGFYTYIAADARDDDRLDIYSIDFRENREFILDGLAPSPSRSWSDYVCGVAAVMRLRGIPIRGANLVLKGNVPIGAGLSSSAALEVATASALLGVSGLDVQRREVASICQRAEHDYAGTKCGIMDQFISCFGEANHALLLDCRSLDYQSLGISEQVRIVVCNTMVKHELASGEYNRRRADCDASVRFLKRFLPDICALRDVTIEQLAAYGAEMSNLVRRRSEHVVSENARVLEAADALRNHDLKRFGELMAESHASLRDNYEVSCPELDLMVDLARRCRGAYGARMTGGGFGGCTVNLVDADAIEGFKTSVAHGYQQATGLQPEIYVCAAADGAHEIGIRSE